MTEIEKNEAPMSEDKGLLPTEEHATMSEPAPAEDVTSGRKGGEDRALRCIGAVLFALIFLLAGLMAGWAIGASSVDERARDLAWLVERVEGNYYREIDDEELYERLFTALELDRFCSYYNEDAYEGVVSESEGNNEGFGISLLYEGDAVRLYCTVYDSPAERAGLETGMYIYRYGEDKDHLETATSENFYAWLTGRDSMTVEAGFSPDETKIYTCSRAAYLASYCEYRDSDAAFRFREEDEKLRLTQVGEGMKVLDGDTAYLRLTAFNGNAAEEFEACLAKMKERGRKHLVLDLRTNGGGYLSTLCEIASHLLRNAEGSHPLVATSRYRSGKQDNYVATGNDFAEYFSSDSRIRVLADENSASASEALMGAMIDYGTISAEDIYIRVSETDGEEVARTFGKGVMQSTFVTPNGRALRLTVAEIRWPKGNSIHGVGIRAEGDHAIKADPLAPAEVFLGAL